MPPQPPDAAPPSPDAPARDGPAAWDRSDLEDLLERLDEFRQAMTGLERQVLAGHPAIHPAYRASARNLAHYLALRRRDLRDTQARLRRLGLSTLARGEGQVLASLDAVRRVVHGLLGRPFAEPPEGEHPVAIDGAAGRLDAHAEALFGPRPSHRRSHLMVTMPSEAASDPAVARDLVAAGMEVARVNCAHDGPEAWEAMARHAREAAAARGGVCRILVDLAGPKLRTGPIRPGPRAAHWSPRRDARGEVVAPAVVLLSRAPPPAVAAKPLAADAVLYPPAGWLAGLAAGDAVEFRDLKGRPRRLTVVRVAQEGVLAHGEETAWVDESVVLARRPAGEGPVGPEVPVGPLPPVQGRVEVRPGETLVLTREDEPGRPAVRDAEGRVLEPARVPCTLAAAFARVKEGDSVWIDDGKVGARVRTATADAIVAEIFRAKPTGTFLVADRGINLPDTDLGLSGFTEKDRADLSFALRHADLVGLSFVRGPSDVRAAWKRIREEATSPVGLVVKIETRRAFERLPDILLAAMEGWPAGVMIARGDLAVECGFERLAEVQEEMLWICEAAHLPVVWATQVLERLAKKGIPTRAEVTDAAMSERAECVMLNKGPYVAAALKALDDILRRMQSHMSKKHSLLRSLRVSSHLE